MRRLRKHGRAGATARGLADTEAAGEAVGVRLVQLGLVMVTRSNRFLLTNFASKAVPDAIAWEEWPPARHAGGRTGRRIGRLPSVSG
jgi:hypothetical protein